MNALMIATITVKDPAKFQQYIAKTQKVAAHYGAELVFRGNIARALTNHDTDHGIAIVVRFPSIEKLNEWIDSDEYQPLVALRDEGADLKMTSYAA